MHFYNLRIAEREFFRLQTNRDFYDTLVGRQPYSLSINFFLEAERIDRLQQPDLIISESAEELDVRFNADGILLIRGDYTPMYRSDYNPQFGLFGNKGLLNKFILHKLEEERGIATLHACAVVHPNGSSVCIGLGVSGSGKSVFIANALQVGWKLVATEHVLVDQALNLLRGNVCDNIAPSASEFLSVNLPSALMYRDRRLIEPTNEKFIVDYSAYAHQFGTSIDLTRVERLYLIVLNFGDPKTAGGLNLVDQDFLLRTIQFIASEKVSAPVIFHNRILGVSLAGDPLLRSRLINHLLTASHAKIVLGGTYTEFANWLAWAYRLGVK